MVDIDAARRTIVEFLTRHHQTTDTEGYVLGVSGGLDSAVAAHLAVEAVGRERVTGLLMPGRPTAEKNRRDAREVCRNLGVRWREIDIAPLVDAVRETNTEEADRQTVGNVRARVRMVLWYKEANEHDLLVLGPDNRSELLLGYFTKYGDGGVDVAPLGGLYKTGVYDLVERLDLDDRFAEKTPTAELWEGQTDEGELGASYATIDPILRSVVDEGASVTETATATGTDEETVRRFVEMWRRSRHKRETPPIPDVRG